MLAGALNGLLVTRIKLPPFIVTLGTLSIFTAVGLMYSQGQTISLSPNTLHDLDRERRSRSATSSITIGVLMMLLLYVVFAFVLGQTAWGRHVYAIGDDPEAARLAGIRINRVLLSVYVVAGAVYGIAAWILIGRIDGARPERRPRRQPGDHHRRRDRRHQPVRRPRCDRRHR